MYEHRSSTLTWDRKSSEVGSLRRIGGNSILFIRHGKSVAHEGKATAYAKEVSLTPEGQIKAQTLADQLPRRPDLIISSPYLRAREMANPTRQRFPDTPYVIWQEVQEFAYLALIDGIYSTKEERSQWVEEYWRQCNPFWRECKKSESFTQFVQRTNIALNRLEKLEGFIVVFTHEQFMRAAQSLLTGQLKDRLNSANGMSQFRQKLMDSSIPFGGVVEVQRNASEMREWETRELWLDVHNNSEPEYILATELADHSRDLVSTH
jgi:broad specificity phosphatase PhoE